MSKLTDIWNSFKHNKEGASGRKLSAFWAIVVVSTYISYKYTTTANVIEMTITWLVFALVCLGLVTIPELLKYLAELKNGKRPSEGQENI
jgi:hypothetical protein